jgi:hypothetical protein
LEIKNIIQSNIIIQKRKLKLRGFYLKKYFNINIFPIFILILKINLKLSMLKSNYESFISEIIDNNEIGYLVEKQDSVDLAK